MHCLCFAWATLGTLSAPFRVSSRFGMNLSSRKSWQPGFASPRVPCRYLSSLLPVRWVSTHHRAKMAHPSGGRTPPDHRKLRAKIVRGWLRADALVAPAGVANGKTKPAAFGGAKPLTLKKGHLGDFPRCRQGSERPGERPSSYLMQPPRCKGSSAPETPCRCLGGDSPPHSKLKYRVPGSSAIFFIPSPTSGGVKS